MCGDEHADNPEDYDLFSETGFIRLLAEGGFASSMLFVDFETAKSVFTDERMALIEIIRDEEVESVSDLADRLGRGEDGVSRDLDLLFVNQVVEYEYVEGRKKPRLMHERVLVEPLL